MSAARIGRITPKPSNVVPLSLVTTQDLSPDLLLWRALGELSEVVIIGFDSDGAEYFASSKGNGPDVLWLIERSRHKLMTIVDEQTGDA